MLLSTSIRLCSDNIISKCIGETNDRLCTDFHCTLMNLQTLEKYLEVNCWSFKEVPKEIIKDNVFKTVNESFETKKIL